MQTQNDSLLYLSDQAMGIGGYDLTTYFTRYESVCRARQFSAERDGG